MSKPFPEGAPPAVIVISSHVARGSVGNRAAVFALETLGFPVWAVPTVLLPWHPGHGPATRIVPDTEQFAAFLADLGNAPWLGEVAAVMTGYLGAASQADAVASLVEKVRTKNPSALYVCDPVLGDRQGLYVPEQTAIAIRDTLMPLADLATPNRYELEWLTGSATPDTAATVAAARKAAPPRMLVTSAPTDREGRLANLLVGRDDALRAEHDAIAKAPNGTGDLTAALFLAHTLQGDNAGQALALTTGSVVEILGKAAARGADELMLETDRPSLTRPQTAIEVKPMRQPYAHSA
ncbi:pyridoxal kinase PdxY [Nitratireductor pacificus]|uniref:pyridoxal kinase n=1 Tax=Nitratireductor pacificus pht-3B TaxID=391937 RepID=K2MN42_9HYPH|nr:pyridoxal kinase PdxY [Nitratireductor pacificus]EKF18657.1 pyridoxamine kinase [Nitratireductor pacificus pht-3B]